MRIYVEEKLGYVARGVQNADGKSTFDTSSWWVIIPVPNLEHHAWGMLSAETPRWSSMNLLWAARYSSTTCFNHLRKEASRFVWDVSSANNISSSRHRRARSQQICSRSETCRPGRSVQCNAPVRQGPRSDGPKITKTTKRKAADGTAERSVRLSLLRLNELVARISSDP